MKPKHLLQSLLLSLLVANVLQAQPADYIGYWPFNGNANDVSGNGYHLTHVAIIGSAFINCLDDQDKSLKERIGAFVNGIVGG